MVYARAKCVLIYYRLYIPTRKAGIKNIARNVNLKGLKRDTVSGKIKDI